MISKFFLILKKNWKIVLLLLGFLLTFAFFKKRDQTFFLRIKKIQEDHKKEIEKMNEAREKERLLNEQNEAKLKETLKEIQSQYELEKKQLDKKKQQEIKTLIREHGDDPDELAVQLSKVTGFKVILPEKD